MSLKWKYAWKIMLNGCFFLSFSLVTIRFDLVFFFSNSSLPFRYLYACAVVSVCILGIVVGCPSMCLIFGLFGRNMDDDIWKMVLYEYLWRYCVVRWYSNRVRNDIECMRHARRMLQLCNKLTCCFHGLVFVLAVFGWHFRYISIWNTTWSIPTHTYTRTWNDAVLAIINVWWSPCYYQAIEKKQDRMKKKIQCQNERQWNMYAMSKGNKQTKMQ